MLGGAPKAHDVLPEKSYFKSPGRVVAQPLHKNRPTMPSEANGCRLSHA